MELTITYLLSQVFTIIMYILLVATYYCKKREEVLILSLISSLANAIAYILLNAWTGLATCIVALIRNIIFIIDEKKNGKREKISKTDKAVLIVICILLIITTIFTYDGFWSLFPVFATMLYTYSICQKESKTYKLLGAPVGICWIIYNAYVMSIFGIILEGVLLFASVGGYILETKKKQLLN